MANRMQKLIFNISTVSPMGFILACVYWVQQNVPQIVDEVTGKVVLQKQHYFLLFFFYALLHFASRVGLAKTQDLKC